MQFIHQTIKEELDAGRVGCPVFVRCIAQVAKDSEHLTDALMDALATAGSWLGASPLRVYAQGSKDVGQITATVLYERGQTALVSVGLAKPDGAPRIDLMLLGNKGALYHDGISLSPFAYAAVGSTASVKLPPIPKPLMDAVERSLRTGKPATVGTVNKTRSIL